MAAHSNLSTQQICVIVLVHAVFFLFWFLFFFRSVKQTYSIVTHTCRIHFGLCDVKFSLCFTFNVLFADKSAINRKFANFSIILPFQFVAQFNRFECKTTFEICNWILLITETPSRCESSKERRRRKRDDKSIS